MRKGWYFLSFADFTTKEAVLVKFYYMLGQPKEKVMKRLGVQKTRFYEMKKNVDRIIERQYRQAKLSNRRLKRPLGNVAEELEQKENKTQTPSQSYIECFGEEKFNSLPKRRQTDAERLEKKVLTFRIDNKTK